MIDHTKNDPSGIGIKTGKAARINAPMPVTARRKAKAFTEDKLNRGCVGHNKNPPTGMIVEQRTPRGCDACIDLSKTLAAFSATIDPGAPAGAGFIGKLLQHLAIGEAFPVTMVRLGPILIEAHRHTTPPGEDFLGSPLSTFGRTHQGDIKRNAAQAQRNSTTLAMPVGSEGAIAPTLITALEIELRLTVTHKPDTRSQ